MRGDITTALKDVCLEMVSRSRSLKQGWRVSFPVLKVGIANTQSGKRYSEIKRDGYPMRLGTHKP